MHLMYMDSAPCMLERWESKEGEKERLGEASGRPPPRRARREGEGGRVKLSHWQLERPRLFQIVIHRTVHALRASKTASA